MKKIDIDSFTDICLIGSPRFSEDGRFAAFLLKRPSLVENAYRSDVYLLERESMSVSALTASGQVTGFCWSSPETILFSAALGQPYQDLRRDDREFSVYYEIHINGGEAEEAFCIPLPVKELHPLGAGRFLARTFCRRDWMDFYRLLPQERRAQARAYSQACCTVFEDYPFLGDGQSNISARRMGLWLYDRPSGALEPLTEPDFHVSGYDIRNGLLVYAGAAYGGQAQPLDSGVYLRGLEDGGVKCLAEPGGWAVDCLGFLEDTVYLARTDTRPGPARGYPELCFVDPVSGRASRAAAFEHGFGKSTIACDSQAVEGQLICRSGERLYFCTTVDEESCICSLDKTGAVRCEIHTRGACGGFDVLEGQILWSGQRDGGLQELYLGERQVTFFNQAFLSKHTVVRPERLSCAAPDGTELRGFVMKPSAYRPDRRYPAILSIHGGPCTTYSDVYFHEMQVWANRGYFVFFCNPRGSDGRGEDFANIHGRYGEVDYEDLMAFLDGALLAYPEADPRRLGVVGGSYGGFMTNWIVSHTGRFACAVSLRSVSNWTTLEFLSDIGQKFVRRELGATTETSMPELWRRSPLRYASGAKTPTLLIHSDHDFRCHMVESVSMYNALLRAGVETRLCLIKGESHGLSRTGRPLQRIVRMEKMQEWLDAHLLEDKE